MELIKKNFRNNTVQGRYPVDSKRVYFKTVHEDYLAVMEFSY
jgi:hypothetical protein